MQVTFFFDKLKKKKGYNFYKINILFIIYLNNFFFVVNIIIIFLNI